ncbi:hypothetical protein ACUNWD_14240 [Sunxiuqinia sp. A32]|uniref:hypothetical protein n=1 Tax=Sunxiuqinia sp. A32 TaxID=3461496 RepID=UPI0040456F47
MRNLCIYCSINLPVIFRTYRFLEIGTNHDYLDEQKNHAISKEFLVSQILPVLEICQKMADSTKNKHKISFNINGPSFLLMNQYAANFFQVFKKLLSNSNIEFLVSPYSTPSLYKQNSVELISQLNYQQNILNQYLPKVSSAYMVSKKNATRRVLREINEFGINPLLFHLPNKLSELIRTRQKKYEHQYSTFNDQTADRKITRKKETLDFLMHELDSQLSEDGSKENVEFLRINIHYQQNRLVQEQVIERLRNTFNFIRRFDSEVTFLHPSECINSPSWKVIQGDTFNENETVSSMNEIQTETCQYLYYLAVKMKSVQDGTLLRDWQLIRDASHLFYMDSRFFNDNFASKHFNPFASPYTAFINYTNILEDFTYRLDKAL